MALHGRLQRAIRFSAALLRFWAESCCSSLACLIWGAILCVLVLSNVFALNIAYNVNVKLFSFNLLLMAIFLAAPEIPLGWRGSWF